MLAKFAFKVVAAALILPLLEAADCIEGDSCESFESAHMVSLMQQYHRLVSQKPSTPFNFWGYTTRRIDGPSSELQLRESHATTPGGQEAAKTTIALDPPSTEPQMLETSGPYYSQWGQEQLLEPIISKLGPDPFFVESGALNGEQDSNTLYYEMTKNWTGLLVEPNPRNYPILMSKHRHAWAFNGCLAPSGHAEFLRFSHESSPDGGLAKVDTSGEFTVVAQPLEALLQKLGRKTVDFWSLDIEGSEAAVLQTTNFSNVEVGMLLIEMNKGDENNRGIREVLDREGFQKIGDSLYTPQGAPGQVPLDGIFVNPKYFQKRGLAVPVHEDLKYSDYKRRSSTG